MLELGIIRSSETVKWRNKGHTNFRVGVNEDHFDAVITHFWLHAVQAPSGPRLTCYSIHITSYRRRVFTGRRLYRQRDRRPFPVQNPPIRSRSLGLAKASIRNVCVGEVGWTVVQRKFDFTRLAESALLDDFEIVTRVQSAAEAATSSLTSLPSRLAAAAADRCSHTTLNANVSSHRNVAYLQPISKHVYVSFVHLKCEKNVLIAGDTVILIVCWG